MTDDRGDIIQLMLYACMAGVRADVMVTFSDAAAPEGRPAPAPRRTLSERFRYEAVRSPEGWRLARVDSTPVWAIG